MKVNKNMQIEFSSALTDVVEANPSFDAARLRIAYTGKNRNNSFISKEAFERAIPTMFNCPVVANYLREDDEIGSHDGEFVKDKDGEVKYVNITEPVGVVPESATWCWEEVDDNQELHQYLCTDVLLWKRQEAYDKIKKNGVTRQSMEIVVNDGEMQDDYYEINDFCFTAFCLLGTAEPCFESASLFTFEQQEQFKAQFSEMMQELKLAFATADKNKKEEENLLKELMEKYQVTEEMIDFEYEGLSDEELEALFAEKFTIKPEPIPAEPKSNPKAPAEPEFSLNSQMRESLCDAVAEGETIETEWGCYARYFVVDFDEAEREVYFYDSTDYRLYGAPFELDGDDVVVDWKCKKKKKYSIVDYIEGEGKEFVLFKLIDTFNEKWKESKVDVDEFARLREFETATLEAQRADDEAELFAKFEEKLNENEEFKALKEKAAEYTLDALEKELFALVGKCNFSMEEKPLKPGIVVEKEKKITSKSDVYSLFAWKEKDEEDNKEEK